MQPRSSEPHGTLRVHISHEKAPGHHFRDVVTIDDGDPTPVGARRGGDLTLRLSPGTHLVKLSSTQVAYDLEPVTREDPDGPCLMPTCEVRASHARRSVELVPHDEVLCEKNVQVEVSPGTTTQVEYATGVSTCEGG